MIDHYQIEARKTAIYPSEFKLAYPTLGLSGESAELWDKLVPDKEGGTRAVPANVVAPEMGDVLWYLVNVAHDADILFNDLAEDLTGGLCPSKFSDLHFQLVDSTDKRSPYVKLVLSVGATCETVKKIIRDDGGNLDPKLDRLRGNLGDVLRAWLEVCDKHQLDPDDVALGNLIKLRKRSEEGKIQGDGDFR